MKPSIEVASNMADILDVSLDWLAGRSDVHLDQQILTRITDVQQLPEQDRDSLLLTIDNFIKATKLKAIQ